MEECKRKSKQLLGLGLEGSRSGKVMATIIGSRVCGLGLSQKLNHGPLVWALHPEVPVYLVFSKGKFEVP